MTRHIIPRPHKMRFHLLGSLAVPTIPELTACAFTQTVWKYAGALHRAGHHVTCYVTEEYADAWQAICDEVVIINSLSTFFPLLSEAACMEVPLGELGDVARHASENAWRLFFGPVMWRGDVIAAFSYGPYLSNVFSPEVGVAIHHVRGEVRKGMAAVLDHIQPKDVVLVFWDTSNRELFDECASRGGIVVEALAQYGGVQSWAPQFNRTIFASRDQCNHRKEEWKVVAQHQYVIPPIFNVDEFTFNPHPRSPKGPFLYLARIQSIKGAEVVLQLAREFPDLTFWIAGAGEYTNGVLHVDSDWYLSAMPNVKYWGVADSRLRARLLSEATALIQPSLYREPFGWNVVEAHLSGTPAIAPHRGAFPENIIDGVNGFLYQVVVGESVGGSFDAWHCRLVACASLDPVAIRERAVRTYAEPVVIADYVSAMEAIVENPGSLYAS